MPATRLYVRGVPSEASNAEIIAHLKRFGQTVEIKILPGYLFVEYYTIEDAKNALHNIETELLCGSMVTVEYARPDQRRRSFDSDKSESQSETRNSPGFRRTYPVRVQNLPDNARWADLKDFGRLVGHVAFCDIHHTDPTQGFIEYTSQKDADAAIAWLDDRKLKGTRVRVSPFSAHRSSRERSRSPATREDRPRHRRHHHRSSSFTIDIPRTSSHRRSRTPPCDRGRHAGKQYPSALRSASPAMAENTQSLVSALGLSAADTEGGSITSSPLDLDRMIQTGRSSPPVQLEHNQVESHGRSYERAVHERRPLQPYRTEALSLNSSTWIDSDIARYSHEVYEYLRRYHDWYHQDRWGSWGERPRTIGEHAQ